MSDGQLGCEATHTRNKHTRFSPEKNKNETKTKTKDVDGSRNTDLVNSRTISSIKAIHADYSRNHRITPPSTFPDFFLENNFCSYPSTQRMSAQATCQNLNSKKRLSEWGPLLWKGNHCVGGFLAAVFFEFSSSLFL